MEKRRGRYSVFEGLDGIGKGTVIGSVMDALISEGNSVIDFSTWCDFPEEMSEGHNLDYTQNVFLVSEPTYFGVGQAIRKEIVARKKEGRTATYSVNAQMQAYALDREILLKRLVLPVLNANATVLSSRNITSSLCYQVLGEMQRLGYDLSNSEERQKVTRSVRDRVLEIEGNAFAIRNLPDLTVISTIRDVDSLRKRLEAREKQDNCIFENISFQTLLKPLYEDASLKVLLESAGSRVAYLDAGISIESSREQAVEIYRDFYENGGLIKPRYQNP